jgi:hypothetical protein
VPLPAGKVRDQEWFSFREGFASDKLKILRDHDTGLPG